MVKPTEAQDKVFELLFEEDEITWQSILFNLVSKENMDPWDVDLFLLSKQFFEMLKTLKGMDFRIPGKVILASAFLLRIKSSKLVDEDLLELDQLIASTEQMEDDYDDLIDFEEFPGQFSEGNIQEKEPALIPRTPQPRKRKVSIYDLVDALEKALEVRRRRVDRAPPVKNIVMPENTIEIGVLINSVFKNIKSFFSRGNSGLTFSHLVPEGGGKEDKIFTFIPLLHLYKDRKIELEQPKHFGEIGIDLLRRGTKVPKKP